MKKKVLVLLTAISMLATTGCAAVTTSETPAGESTVTAGEASAETQSSNSATTMSDTVAAANGADLEDYVVPAKDTGKALSDIKIGLSFAYTDTDEFTVAQYNGALDEAEAQGVTLHITDAHSDEATQANDVIDLIQQGMDVIGIYPVNFRGSMQCCRYSGIPVLHTSCYQGDRSSH